VVTTKDVVFFGRVWLYSWVHFDYVKVREKRRGNEEWTRQRRGLLWAQDTERRQTKQKTTTTQTLQKKNNTEQNKAKQKQTRRLFVYLNGNMLGFWLN